MMDCNQPIPQNFGNGARFLCVLICPGLVVGQNLNAALATHRPSVTVRKDHVFFAGQLLLDLANDDIHVGGPIDEIQIAGGNSKHRA